jgi:hypothetical protein
MNMGIEPFLVATSVNLIVAQRLIRRVCQKCKAPEDAPIQALLNVGFSEAEAPNIQLYKGRGCEICNQRGYKGRVGLYRPDPFGNEVKVAVSEFGTPLGELSFFSNKLHSSKGVTLKETYTLILTREGYEKLKEEDPKLAIKLLEAMVKVIAERLKEMNKKFVDTTCFIWGGPKK